MNGVNDNGPAAQPGYAEVDPAYMIKTTHFWKSPENPFERAGAKCGSLKLEAFNGTLLPFT